jgi:hypothetical protein
VSLTRYIEKLKMRGFCAERNEARDPKQFEEIGNMRGVGVQFDLSPYSRKLH